FRRTLNRRIEVILELTKDSDVVLGDFSQLEQVVMNLAVNARDAIPDSGTITLRTWRSAGADAEGDSVVFEVSDTGTGIDPAIHHRIFEPYFTTKTSGPVRGTGLGLATVYGIVESHGGLIQALANKPRGTTIQVHLPATKQRVLERPAQFNGPRTVLSGSGLILLAEDEPLLREAVSEGLCELGYRVVSASNGTEAVMLFERHSSELSGVILDMVMPRMGGQDAYVQMRKINAKIPVLLTTGYAKNEEAQQILDLGVGGFLPKPYDVAMLSEALSRLIQR
ncbi:MAG: ATP-binding protein, partial [Myxococcaceae bacterium]